MNNASAGPSTDLAQTEAKASRRPFAVSLEIAGVLFAVNWAVLPLASIGGLLLFTGGREIAFAVIIGTLIGLFQAACVHVALAGIVALIKLTVCHGQVLKEIQLFNQSR